VRNPHEISVAVHCARLDNFARFRRENFRSDGHGNVDSVVKFPFIRDGVFADATRRRDDALYGINPTLRSRPYGPG
jgi:hypothetical protein